MARTVVVDAGFLVALLSRRDEHHQWAAAQSRRFPGPWKSCEAVVSEAFHLVGPAGQAAVSALLRRGVLVPAFGLAANVERVLKLMEKYCDVPMSFADACLVRMTETQDDPIVLTTDGDFRIYRRHGRQVVPTVTP